MPGQRGLHRHVGGGQIADFAHHDDVGILAHQGAQPLGKVEVEVGLHLGLVEGRLDHLDGVFNGVDVHLLGGQALQGGIQRGGFARTSGAGHQNDAVRALDQRLPAPRIVRRKTQCIQPLDGGVGVENPHHHLFAKGGGQGGQAHFHLVAARVLGFDAAILRAALFHHVHAAQQLDAGRHRAQHAHGQLVHRVQHAVDAKADHPLLAPGLQVDVAGTLVKGVLPQPVHHLHHTLVVGIELAVAAAQLHQLLKTGLRARIGLDRHLHRFGQRIELARVTLDVQRVGNHQAHAAPRLALHLGNPVEQARLGCGHHHLCRPHLHRQHLVALGVGGRHGLGHPAHIHLQRVDADKLHMQMPGQPLGQRIQRQYTAIAGAGHAHHAQALQRRLGTLARRATHHGALRLGSGDHPIGGQPGDEQMPVERPLKRQVQRRGQR